MVPWINRNFRLSRTPLFQPEHQPPGTDRAAECGIMWGRHCLCPHSNWSAVRVWQEPLASYSDVIKRPLLSNRMCSKLFVTAVPPPQSLFNSSGMWRVGMRHWTGSPVQVSSFLSCTGQLPPWSEEGPKSPRERSVLIRVRAEVRAD